jgi:hypothetical protein
LSSQITKQRWFHDALDVSRRDLVLTATFSWEIQDGLENARLVMQPCKEVVNRLEAARVLRVVVDVLGEKIRQGWHRIGQVFRVIGIHEDAVGSKAAVGIMEMVDSWCESLESEDVVVVDRRRDRHSVRERKERSHN